MKENEKQSDKIDNIMSNLNLEKNEVEDMDDRMDNFEKQFNPGQQFNKLIYDNIDKEFEKNVKIFGVDEEWDVSSSIKNNNELIEEEELLKDILGQNRGDIKKKENDMDELAKALKTADVNLNKKNGKDKDTEALIK